MLRQTLAPPTRKCPSWFVGFFIGGVMVYQEKLKDPRWQKKRLEIMERDEWKCKGCGDHEKTLNVHHINYTGDPWEVEDDDAQTLCEDCHKALGPHPKGGVSWDGNFFMFSCCPICGNKNVYGSKSWRICGECSHEILPISFPFLDATKHIMRFKIPYAISVKVK